MALFNYVAKNKGGQDVRSSLEAASRLEALEFLRTKGLTVIDLISVEAAKPQITIPNGKGKKGGLKSGSRRWNFAFSSPVKMADLAVFCRQLAISVGAGLPLRDALETIGTELDQADLREAIADIAVQLTDGAHFSDAAATHPKIFNVMFCGLIKVAEESGKLPQTLSQLADYLERTDKLQRRIKAMSSYPVFIGIFFVLVCLIMSFVILPKFADIFMGFDAALPPLTQMVFSLNAFFVGNFVFLALGVGLLFGGIILYGRTKDGAFRRDRLKLALPGVGDLLKKYVMARFCRSLSIMMHSGVSISTALEICGDAAGNRVLQQSIRGVRERIITGQRISKSLGESGIFPGLITRMVSVGEDSGQLPEVLDRVSDLYEDQVETKIMSTMALFEPLVICVFGGLVMILVMAIYLPIISISLSVK